MNKYSFISNAHPSYIENLYRQYKSDPTSVETDWHAFFKGFEFAGNSVDNGAISEDMQKEFGVMGIIHGFRDRGHLLSDTNPVKPRKDRKPFLDISDYGLVEADLDKSFKASLEIGMVNGTLRDVLNKLNLIYCGKIGFEIQHIENRERRVWLREKIELNAIKTDYGIPLEKKQRILEKLNGAIGFEKFLHTKYVGQKRFSLEGGDSTIPGLDAIINHASVKGVKEIAIGMAHRGRLNVLANIMGKTYQHIFNEFEGNEAPDKIYGAGDVKYHLGFSSQLETLSGEMIDVKLVPNPSHLESVDPIVEGFSRAKADILYDSNYDSILPILIHGDAAIAGQGVVYEIAQMSKLPGYLTGGTLHFVINNQIGFTTSFEEARSSTYSTSVANVMHAPVFHVNGDCPEALLFVCELAVEYRQEFNEDVFIDMVCYRKHGHNEGDDPNFTQPELYDLIKKHPSPRRQYVNKLIERGDVEADLAKGLEDNFWNDLQDRLNEVRQKPLPYVYQEPEQAWRKLKKNASDKDFELSPSTGIKKGTIDHIIDKLMTYPDDFIPIGKVNRLLKGKRKLIDQGVFDWAMAELMAYGSILMDGQDVRLSGQDVRRGTFSHRHAVFYDKNSYEPYNRLAHLSGDQGRFRIFNSLLSEFAVLGFEFGYSLSSPNNLVIWEAQFGDFYNGAQTIIDQYISASESKWNRMSGLVMLLPHGYEGQGPEHSSAKMERFLMQCAENNMSVINPTTPANIFHALRRQLARPFRKPLIVFSPKSLLRHPKCVSSISDFEDKKTNTFKEVYDDSIMSSSLSKKVKRVLFCTGKIYYELLSQQTSKDVAIVRIEQLYPFPKKQIEKILKKYKQAEMVWVQEEPQNMGAWIHILCQNVIPNVRVISRPASASTATGFKKIHDREQQEIMMDAFGLE